MTEGDMQAGIVALRKALEEASRGRWVDYNKHVTDEAARRAVYLIIDAVDKHRARHA